MKKVTLIASFVGVAGIAAPAWLIASGRENATAINANAPAPLTMAGAHDDQLSRRDTPADGVEALVYARRFRLDRPYKTRWSKERRSVESGYLVVIRVQPEYVYPHEAATPVLYAGDRPVERINIGYQDGHVIGIIPGDVHPGSTPIYFGAPDFPERVTAARGVFELQGAQSRGVSMRPAAEVANALQIGAAELSVRDKAAVLREAGRLIQQYAPSEADLGAELQALPG